MTTSNTYICECGKFDVWLHDGEWTNPCPNCGRRYLGKYSRKKLSIVPYQVMQTKKETD